MRNYLEDWLSEEESVVVPPPAQSVSRQRRTKQGEEAEGGNSAGQTSGKQIENDGARMVWTETLEAGGGTAGESLSGPLAEEQAVLPMVLSESQAKQAARGALYAAMGKVGRVERRRWNIWTGRCSGMRGGMTVGFRCIKRFDLGKEGRAWR